MNSTEPIFVDNIILLKCEVDGGIPFASISWHCESTFDEKNTTINNKVQSTVKLKLKKSDNNKSCECIAYHLSWESQKTTDIILNVLYAPDSNLTVQRTPVGEIFSGKRVTLTCIASGGNPLATLAWNCSGTNSNQSTGNLVSNTVEFKVNKSDNNKVCKCSAFHPVTTYTPTVENRLLVYYAPESNTSIQQTPPGGIVTGENVTLTCIVFGGNPVATLSWNCTGINKNSTTSAIASYSIEFVVNKTQSNKICACSAVHPVASYNQTVGHKLLVYYAPIQNPNIEQTPTGGIIAGNNVRLTCTVSGGNPLATLSWNCNGTITNSTSSNIAIYSIDFAVKKIDDSRLCSCTAEHPDRSYKPIENHRLIVYYAPDTNPIIAQTPLGPIVTGNTVTLTCTVPGGNPLAKLSWNCAGTKENNTAGNTSSYSITMSVNKSYNNKICTCTADHIISAYEPTVQHKLVVYYAPDDRPSIEQTPAGGIITGHTVILTCSVKGGNPPAILKWNCTGDTSNGTTDTTANYSVSFPVNKTQNNAICACSASHPDMSYTPAEEHRLDVYCKL
ncbi:unnamed protein product [Mytilus coruscus]|uniref:Ig-like domain-containing protein n=1 Tax=Mytilus coruscus TaxID=42192 RepID=A0A6J8C6E9_MYTCO|nr:unnamed protein product [Mytilus coruscus]